MKLDPRIKSLSDILTIFDIDRAKEFIGQKGYFSDELHLFEDLSTVPCAFLIEISSDRGDYAFRKDDDRGYYRFFIPESSLRPAETFAEKKKWRPFTLDEFLAKFPLLSPVVFRRKENGELRTYSFIGYIASGTIILGNDWRILENLFEDYELKDENGNWTPFGVEE